MNNFDLKINGSLPSDFFDVIMMLVDPKTNTKIGLKTRGL